MATKVFRDCERDEGRAGSHPAKHGVSRLAGAAVLVVSLALPFPLLAHGTIHEQIADLDQRIATSPADAELYLRRGDLHRRHRDWAEALADLDRAAGIDPRAVEVHFVRGETFLDSGRPEDAERSLARYLSLLPDGPEHHGRRASALLLRGKAAAQLGRQLAAAGDYRRAVDLAPRAGPQAFLDCARAFDAAAGEYLEAALRCLDDGLERLGTVVSLERQAIELELRARRFDGALARLDRLAGVSPQPYPWWVERGEVLEQAGRPDEARQAFLEAREAIGRLPPGRRGSRAVVDLEERIAAGLTRLESLATLD